MRPPKEATNLCTFCPKLCRFSCPVSDADQNEATTPWGKMSTMKMVAEKKLPPTSETMGLAYKCLNCRYSQTVCEMENPVSSVLDTFRVSAFRAGLAPASVYSYCERFQRHNNPYDHDLLADLIRCLPEKFKITSPKGALRGWLHRALPVEGATRAPAKTVYFPGCTEIARDPASIGKTFELLHRFRVRDVGLYPESIQCCGYPLFVAGDWDNFVELAHVNSQSLKGYRLVLSGAPACLYTMETLYRAAGYPASPKFMHLAEYLRPLPNPLLSKERVSAGGRRVRSIAYHDPCYLGRYRKVYREPRELIQHFGGSQPIEFFRNRETSYCCGAGGLLPASFPETAKKITENRLAEFRQTGAGGIVTGCPTCVQRFKKYGKGIPVQNLVEFLTDAIKG